MSTITQHASSSSLKVLSITSLEILRNRGDEASLMPESRQRVVSNTSYATRDSLDSEESILVPDEIESAETFEFLEFNRETAVYLWEAYQKWKPSAGPYGTLLSAARGHVKIKLSQSNPTHENDDWEAAMDMLGLQKRFQDRFMKPQWAHMRLTGTLKEWVIEMIEDRYEFLLNLDKRVRAPESQTVARKTSILDLEGNFKTTSAPAIPSRKSSEKDGKSGSSSEKPSQPEVATVAQDPPTQLQGHLMLYKCGTLERLNRVYADNHKLNFIGLLTVGCGDFSKANGLYFSKQEVVAWEYAQWKRVIVDGNVVPVGILQVAVPRELFASSVAVYGDQWRKLVWACRQPTVSVPEELDYLENFQWIQGPICNTSNEQVEKLKSPAELQIMKVRARGRDAALETSSQHFTNTAQVYRLLNQNCVDRVWITSVGAPGEGKSKAHGKDT